MPYTLHLCCFSSLDRLTLRKRADPRALLEFFESTGTRRVSTFEITTRIMRALKQLESQGRLRWIESEYPWHAFELIPPQESQK